MSVPIENQLVDGETIIRHGGNQTGRYIIIQTQFGNLWRLWDNGRQEHVGTFRPSISEDQT